MLILKEKTKREVAGASQKVNIPRSAMDSIAYNAFARAARQGKPLAPVYARLADQFENEYGWNYNIVIQILYFAAQRVDNDFDIDPRTGKSRNPSGK